MNHRDWEIPDRLAIASRLRKYLFKLKYRWDEVHWAWSNWRPHECPQNETVGVTLSERWKGGPYFSRLIYDGNLFTRIFSQRCNKVCYVASMRRSWQILTSDNQRLQRLCWYADGSETYECLAGFWINLDECSTKYPPPSAPDSRLRFVKTLQ